MDWHALNSGFWRVLWPPICAYCRDDLAPEETYPLCPNCRLRLQFNEPPYCRRCSLPSPLSLRLCPNCRGGGGACGLIRSAFLYKEPAASLIHSFKYRGNRSAACAAGEWMGRRWPHVQELAACDALVPVPLSPRRLRERGYNQALLLAREVSRLSGIALHEALERTRDTKPQWRLGRSERGTNVAGAFRTRPGVDVFGRRLVLIDDVCTTGASLNACAETLLAAGAESVNAYVLARETLS